MTILDHRTRDAAGMARHIAIERFAGPGVAWEMAFAEPDPRLAGLVQRLCGYREWSAEPLCRIQPPYSGLPLIIGFGAPITVAGTRYRLDRVSAFMAGLETAAAQTEGSGHQAGVQLDLTPLGAARLLGRPLEALAGQVVRLEDLIGADGRRLAQRLGEATGWDERLTLTEDFVLERINLHRPPPPLVTALWRRLIASRGQSDIAALAADAGVSRKHLTQQFRHWTGLPPSQYARVLRFERAVARIRARPLGVDWAQVAAACGYYDQPHFNRDFRSFTGLTPTRFLAALQPHGGIVAKS
jgi:AraC-like DNA-binding protein